jgi:hypothetical protein
VNAPLPSPALDRACLLIAAQVASRIAEFRRAGLDEATIRRLISQPWRLTGIIRPCQSRIWPATPDTTATDMLAKCASRIAAAERGEQCFGTPMYSWAETVALRQAEAALLRIIMGEEPGQRSPFERVAVECADGGVVMRGAAA